MSPSFLSQLARWLGLTGGGRRGEEAQLEKMLQSRTNTTYFLCYLNHKERDLIAAARTQTSRDGRARIAKRIKAVRRLKSAQNDILDKITAGIDTVVMAKSCADSMASMEIAGKALGDVGTLLGRVDDVVDTMAISIDEVNEACAVLTANIDDSGPDDDELLAELESLMDNSAYLGETADPAEPPELPTAPARVPVNAAGDSDRDLSSVLYSAVHSGGIAQAAVD